MSLADLVALSHAIADPSEDCVILGEGNTSMLGDADDFYVKASGRQLATIAETGFAHVRMSPILQAMDGPDLDDATTKALLIASLCNPQALEMPSTETFMHAYLLSLPGIQVIGHTHPTPLVSLLSTAVCETIRTQRLFPDEIVCCGPSACLVEYGDPGLALARNIREGVDRYATEEGSLPKTIWIRNHGLICLGATTHEVLTATRMSVKAARIWLGALQTGQPIRSLTKEQIARIHTRPDEHYRQKLLWQLGKA